MEIQMSTQSKYFYNNYIIARDELLNHADILCKGAELSKLNKIIANSLVRTAKSALETYDDVKQAELKDHQKREFNKCIGEEFEQLNNLLKLDKYKFNKFSFKNYLAKFENNDGKEKENV